MAEKEGTILLDFDWVDRAVAMMRESDKVNKETQIEKQIDTEWLVEANAMLEKIKKENPAETHNQQNSELQKK